MNSQTFSEDSNHDGSDSDWDGFPDSQQSSSGFDMSDLTETLLKEVSDVIPSKYDFFFIQGYKLDQVYLFLLKFQANCWNGKCSFSLCSGGSR